MMEETLSGRFSPVRLGFQPLLVVLLVHCCLPVSVVWSSIAPLAPALAPILLDFVNVQTTELSSTPMMPGLSALAPGFTLSDGN